MYNNFQNSDNEIDNLLDALYLFKDVKFDDEFLLLCKELGIVVKPDTFI